MAGNVCDHSSGVFSTGFQGWSELIWIIERIAGSTIGFLQILTNCRSILFSDDPLMSYRGVFEKRPFTFERIAWLSPEMYAEV